MSAGIIRPGRAQRHRDDRRVLHVSSCGYAPTCRSRTTRAAAGEQKVRDQSPRPSRSQRRPFSTGGAVDGSSTLSFSSKAAAACGINPARHAGPSVRFLLSSLACLLPFESPCVTLADRSSLSGFQRGPTAEAIDRRHLFEQVIILPLALRSHLLCLRGIVLISRQIASPSHQSPGL